MNIWTPPPPPKKKERDFTKFLTISDHFLAKISFVKLFFTPPRLAVADKVLSNCSTMLCDIPLFSEYIEDSLDGQLTNQTVRLFCQNN